MTKHSMQVKRVYRQSWPRGPRPVKDPDPRMAWGGIAGQTRPLTKVAPAGTLDEAHEKVTLEILNSLGRDK
jgi:hypothetical protein